MGDFNDKPRVAVIVLTYGKFSGLRRTLESVVKQTYQPEGVVISDDGSGQAFPVEITDQFPAMIFRQNRYNLGTVAHMNDAAARIKSDYIKFLAAGDAFSDPDALKELVNFAKATGAKVVTSQSLVCDEALQHQWYAFPGKFRARFFRRDAMTLFQALAVSNCVSATGTLFHRTFFTDMGGFDEEYRLLEDWPTWLRLTRKNGSLPLLRRVTCLYGLNGVSSENVDAYRAETLKRDMLHCYEKEILPYLESFDRKKTLRVRYGYDQLRGLSSTELLSKYGRLEYMTRWKRKVKLYLLSQSNQ